MAYHLYTRMIVWGASIYFCVEFIPLFAAYFFLIVIATTADISKGTFKSKKAVAFISIFFSDFEMGT